MCGIFGFNSSEDITKELVLGLKKLEYRGYDSSGIAVIKNNQLESLWMNTNLMCIGEKTSSILNEIKWKKIFIFNPGEEEFLLYKI